jgi:hypothetical protein
VSVPRAVLDTSALFGPARRRRLQINAALGNFDGYWSPWIIAELVRVLTWQWVARTDASLAQHRACGEACNTMMTLLLPTFRLVQPLPPYPIPWPHLADEWDIPIWAAAKEAGAQFIVSENSRHFPPRDTSGRHHWEGIEYISTDAFLHAITALDNTARP